MKSSRCEFLDSAGNWINGSLEKAATYFLTCYFHKKSNERLAIVRRNCMIYHAERVEKRLLYQQFCEKLVDICKNYKPVYGGNNVVGSCACHYLDALKEWQPNVAQGQSNSLALAKQKLGELKRMEKELRDREAALKRNEEENRAAFKRRLEVRDKISQDIRQDIQATSSAMNRLRNDPSNYEGFWNRKLRTDAQANCNNLNLRLTSLRKKVRDLAISPYKRDEMLAKAISTAKYQVKSCVSEAKVVRAQIREITASMTQGKKQAAQKKAKEKRGTDKAILAHAKGNGRKVAAKIKRQLEITVDCPYCGEQLGEQPHADHIYPQSKGGLSRLKNLVYVCRTCNVRKSDLTLVAFIEECSLDRKRLENRLKELGKEF